MSFCVLLFCGEVVILEEPLREPMPEELLPEVSGELLPAVEPLPFVPAFLLPLLLPRFNEDDPFGLDILCVFAPFPESLLLCPVVPVDCGLR